MIVKKSCIGDSRAVLCHSGVPVALSVDHKPTHPAEEARIRKAGGIVVKSRLQGVLGVSRAFGDIEMKALKARV